MADEGNTRRLAAILAADVVDYSRLMHEDEAGTVAAWQAARRDAVDPTLEANKGRVVKRTGDGFLAEFATVEDAVRCAVAMQAALADSALDFRMGINLGDITDDGDDIHGDGVNIAARLEGLADPGGICISGSVHDQVHNKLDLAFTDMGEQTVKNIARPVRAFKINMGETKTASVTAPPKPTAKSSMAIAASIVVVIAIAGGLFIWEPWVQRVEPASVAKMAHPLPQIPSIAVLPFNDFSENKDQGYFADGLTEEIISNLASFENIFVIARNSTNKFKGKSVDVREVAEDLGVRYVLEGSIRRAGNSLRVTAQLIDAINGKHIWADKYDRQMKDIFALQDEITGEIVSRLVSKVAVAEFKKSSRKHTSSPEAYALFLQGWATYNQLTPQTNQRAIRLFEQAVAKDPSYGRAYAMLGFSRRHNAVNRWGKNAKDTLKHALELTKHAVALDPRDSLSQSYLGNVHALLRQYREAMAAAEKAAAFSPGDANVLMNYANTLVLAGQSEDGARIMDKSFRLDPHGRFARHMIGGRNYYAARQYEKSAQAFASARRMKSRSPVAPMALHAAALAQLGRMNEARTAREQFMALSPNYAIATDRHLASMPDGVRAHLEEGLTKAGYPRTPALKLPDKPSIAVLPFANMSGDKAQEYFSDGITEDIITDLSKVSGLFVIARTSVNRYKGKSEDVRKIARELGVRYVVEGSVRKAAGKVRITAQLIDASNGNHVWAERYDRDLKDVFAIQDDVAGKIVSNLAIKLTSEERERTRRKYTPKPEAHELTVRGIFTTAPPTRKRLAAAQALLEKAIALDANYARPYAGLAQVHALRVLTQASKSPAEDLEIATRMARKAISLDDAFAHPYVALAQILRARGQIEKAVVELENAVRIEPGAARVRFFYGYYLALAGRAEEGLAPTERAIRMAPLNPTVHSFAGATYFIAGQYAKSVAHFERREVLHRRSGVGRESVRAAAEMLAGKEDAARTTIKWMLSRSPKYTVKAAVRNNATKQPGVNDRLADALRRAGLPEGAPPKSAAPPLSIVVLPFDNLSGDKSQGYFADGITEDLITDLSRIRGMFVIARGTSFTYKGMAVKARDVAKDLNVRYVLEGSVRRAGDQVRVNAQLIDGETGAHIWSDRFDRKVRDVFSLQNDVTGRIAAVLKFELLAAESRRLQAGPPANLEARDYALRGSAEIWTKPASKETTLEAKRHLEKALQLNPDSALAWTGMAQVYMAAAMSRYGITKTQGEALRLQLEAARRAVALDPKSSGAFHQLGTAYRVNNQLDKANSACKTAIELNPNNELAYICLGAILNQTGRFAEALPLIEKAVQLNPRARRKAARNFYLGRSYLGLENYKKAVAIAKEGITLSPKFPPQYWILASALGWLGRKEEARSVWADFVRIDKGRRGTIAKMHKRYSHIQKFDHVLEGLRRAGVPEN